MARTTTARIIGILLVVALVVIGVVLVRSCHSTEDPQHSGDDDVTQVAPAPPASYRAA